MKNNRITISIQRLEKENPLYEESFLTPEIFGIEQTDFLIMDDNLNYQFKSQLLASGLVVAGTASTTIKTRCSRCLTPIVEEIESEYTLFFDEITSDDIDITDDIREELMLEIPINSVCDEDCKGFCPICKTNLNNGSCNCNTESEAEPSVWDALDNLEL